MRKISLAYWGNYVDLKFNHFTFNDNPFFPEDENRFSSRKVC